MPHKWSTKIIYDFSLPGPKKELDMTYGAEFRYGLDASQIILLQE